MDNLCSIDGDADAATYLATMDAVDATRAPCRLLNDNFESRDTGRWSAALP